MAKIATSISSFAQLLFWPDFPALKLFVDILALSVICAEQEKGCCADYLFVLDY